MLSIMSIYFPLNLYTNNNFVYDIYNLLNNNLDSCVINIFTIYQLMNNYKFFKKVCNDKIYNIDNRYDKIIQFFDNQQLVKEKVNDLRFVMNFWDSHFICITNLKSNINNWADLKNKKILLSIESTVSSDYYIGKLILQSANLNETDYTIVSPQKN